MIEITYEEFVRYGCPHLSLAGLMAIDREWYRADDSRRVGIIVQDNTDHDFAVVTYQCQPAGNFVQDKLHINLPTLANAREWN